MTPKEKAEELVNKYLMNTPVGFHIDDAKECALISVDEMLEEILENWYGDYINIEWEIDRIKYWKQVKQEIENL